MSKLRDLVERDGDSTGEESDLVALVEEAKRLIAEEEETLMLEKRTQRINIKDESVEVLVAKLDHMRDANQYMKTLAKWCADLHLVMLLVVAKDMGVVVVVEGEEGALGRLITRSQLSLKSSQCMPLSPGGKLSILMWTGRAGLARKDSFKF